jgi:hypothetical protein
MRDKLAGEGSDSGEKAEDSATARRRRQAEQLRRNLLKRKEQGRGRADEDAPAPDGGDDPAQG